jgi:L-asparaginase
MEFVDEVRRVTDKPTIAVFSGPTATIQNTPPLLTSPVARGNGHGGGAVRAQRLAAPAVVYVEQFSAHPLEADAADIYGSPDGYLDDSGEFHATNGDVVPEGRVGVYRIELDPGDGPLLLPYVARTRAGLPWAGSGLSPMAAEDEQRQTFYPDASRLYEEIDRMAVGADGYGRVLSSSAAFDFVRAAPSGGYRRGRAANGSAAITPERRGEHYFNYYPHHLRAEPGPAALVRATNTVQETLSSGRYIGGQWLEGSPTNEESLYWFNLVLDVDVPLVGHSAQRPHGSISADGDKNIADGVRYLTSRVWADETGRDRVGVVMIVDEVIYAAREVAKTDARPGNYVATGGHGGVVGNAACYPAPRLTYVPLWKHTHKSELRLSALPAYVGGVRRGPTGEVLACEVQVKDDDGSLAPQSMPAVTIVKFGRYADTCCGGVEIDAWLHHAWAAHPLGGIIGEGKSPYGSMDPMQEAALQHAAFAGYPIVKCGRGNTGGFTYAQPPWAIRGGNLTATKARILLMAALLKLGALPPARDPSAPTAAEREATAQAVARYQELFDTH